MILIEVRYKILDVLVNFHEWKLHFTCYSERVMYLFRYLGILAICIKWHCVV